MARKKSKILPQPFTRVFRVCVCQGGHKGTLHVVWKGSEDKGNEQWTEMTEMSSFLKREKDRSLWRLPFMIPLKKNTGP